MVINKMSAAKKTVCYLSTINALSPLLIEKIPTISLEKIEIFNEGTFMI